MGERGPPPLPTETLRRRNSKLVTKERIRNEVKGPPGTPRMPAWIDSRAKTVWKALVPMLESMGILTRVDANALARYCQLWCRWRRCEEFIQKHGETHERADGSIHLNPESALSLKLATQLTRLEGEFGLTPSARTRLKHIESETNRNDAEAKERTSRSGAELEKPGDAFRDRSFPLRVSG